MTLYVITTFCIVILYRFWSIKKYKILLNSDDVSKRIDAMKRIRLMRKKNFIPDILNKLSDVNEDVREEARKTANDLGTTKDQFIDIYVKIISNNHYSNNQSVIISSIRNLMQLEEIDHLKEIMLKHAEIPVRKLAAEAIISIDSKKEYLLKKQLKKLEKEIIKLHNKNNIDEYYIFNIFPKVMEFAKEGYDFSITYQQEKRHKIYHPAGEMEVITDTGCGGAGDMGESWGVDEKWRQYTEKIYGVASGEALYITRERIYSAWEEWIIDVPEKIEVIRSKKFD